MSSLLKRGNGRCRVRTAVVVCALSFLLLFLAACGGTAATVAEPTVAQATLLPADTAVPPTETAVPLTETAVPPTAFSPLTSPLAEEMDTMIKEEAVPKAFKGAVLVARGDDVILSQGYGMADVENEIPNTPATKFRISGLTMPFTTLAIMQLHERGLLAVSNPICNYLDDCPAAWEDVTIDHLMTCTSGIPSYILTADFENREDFAAISDTPTPPEQLLASIKELPLGHLPGAHWGPTCDSGYVILGQIIESVSGLPYADFLQENIFDPLGMADTGLEQDPEGLAILYERPYVTAVPDPYAFDNSFAHGNMYSTVEDLYRWAASLGSEQLISQPTSELMFAKHAVIDWDPAAADDDIDLGYGWMLGNANDRPMREMIGMLGDEITSYIIRYREDDLTLIALSNQENLVAWGPDEVVEELAVMALKQE